MSYVLLDSNLEEKQNIEFEKQSKKDVLETSGEHDQTVTTAVEVEGCNNLFRISINRIQRLPKSFEGISSQ